MIAAPTTNGRPNPSVKPSYGISVYNELNGLKLKISKVGEICLDSAKKIGSIVNLFRTVQIYLANFAEAKKKDTSEQILIFLVFG